MVPPTSLIAGSVDYHTLVAIYNLGRGQEVATVFQFENTQGGEVKYAHTTTPYLEDFSITSTRAVKSSVLIQNATAAMYRIPGIHVLRTSQRFKVQLKDSLSHSEAAAIRNAIISDPDTVVLDGEKPVEICNVPTSDTDYYGYMQQVQNPLSYIFRDSTGYAELPHRPMSVIWVAFDNTRYTSPNPLNQTYKFDIYTEQRIRHSVTTAISTHAVQPKPASAKEVVEAVNHSKYLGPLIHK
jgi:hypothetical protein